MNVGILGKGNMGQALGTLLTQSGHTVVFGTRQIPGSYLTAAQAEVVILALPYQPALELLRDPGFAAALGNRILVDIVNPLTPDFRGLTVGFSDSAAEQIARLVPKARVVKAFNTVFADVLTDLAQGKKVPVTVLMAGDDTAAKVQVGGLVRELGLEVQDLGPLTEARFLEPAVQIVIGLGYRQGKGSHLGLRVTGL